MSRAAGQARTSRPTIQIQYRSGPMLQSMHVPHRRREKNDSIARRLIRPAEACPD
ncbi:hypothetical protein [Lysobacter gummosus]|uniref:hypothetical protein n=1 Tax=Lysobacter gummosus TaxID=262324 RepID=UPI00362F5CD7